MIKSKSQLAITLSKLAVFDNSQLKLKREQYATDSEAVAEALWFAYMQGDIKGKVVADLGCGTGLLGIAALLLGAEKIYFVESDKDALEIAKKNIVAVANPALAGLHSRLLPTCAEDPTTAAKAVLVHGDVKNFATKVDTVVQNPPFGTKTKHADREFLAAAFKAAGIVYSFHKAETADFVKRFAAENGFEVTNIVLLQLQLKPTYEFHRSRMRRVEVGLFRIEMAKLQRPITF